METILVRVACSIETLQFAVLDMADKLDKGKATICVADVEKANYVMGMCALNSANLESIVKDDCALYKASSEKCEALLCDAEKFSEALVREGFGLVPN